MSAFSPPRLDSQRSRLEQEAEIERLKAENARLEAERAELLTTLLSPAQVARRLNLTPRHVRRLLHAGELASVPTALGRLIAPEHLEAFRQQRMTTVTAEALDADRAG